MQTRRQRLLLCLAILALGGLVSQSVAVAADRPNIVWIIADDLGPELGCYGYEGVATTSIDRLADRGTRYTAAFSTAPVCSASRTAFQTGRYQTAIGGHHHNTRDKRPLPESITTVTGLMQQAGYYVINGHGYADNPKLAKSHLNFVYDARTFFDDVDWAGRSDGQPFFAQLQIKQPHRPFETNQTDRPEAAIPPYYPKHPVVRADWDNYLASIETLDRKVGDILTRLEDEGLTGNTLVMFFGDHGRPHARGKQWLYDGGLNTPLIIRWPGYVEAGVVDDSLVSLLDLMPTTLAAAGVPIPELPGQNLLAAGHTGHDRLFAARDRCGDAIDRIRSVRTNRYKYIRNFHPERPYLQHSGYKKLSYPTETVMKVLHARGEWTSPFMASSRPNEELYDLQADPWEMTNLADDPAHETPIRELRAELDEWIERTNDQGAIEESRTVDLDAVLAEKWKTYARRMKHRGLSADVSDEDYLRWWERQLLSR